MPPVKLLLPLLTFFLLALSLFSPLAGAIPLLRDAITCRAGPGTSYEAVKSFVPDTAISLECQGAGPDNTWGKTTDGCYVADYLAKTSNGTFVSAFCNTVSDGDARSTSASDLPGLNPTQNRNAWKIIKELHRRKLGHRACLASIATAIVESRILIYANPVVSESMKYPHDAVGGDQDSIGIFQQRVQ